MLKRALRSLLYHWKKNVMILLLFAALFAVAVGSLCLYATTQSQVDRLQTALGNAVTLKGVGYSYKGSGGSRMLAGHLSPEVVETFVTDPRVQAYNFADYLYLSFPEAEGVYQEAWEENKSGSMFTTYTTMGYVPVDTSLDQTFTVYGFQLVEGEHLTGATLYEKACLISDQFAQRNGLSVGDDLQVKVPFLAEAEPVALRVQGIFSAPETQYQITGLGNRPEELVFLTPQAMCAVEGREDGREVAYSMGTSRFATVYLSSEEDVDSFVKDVQKKIAIRQVWEEHYSSPTLEPIPQEYAGMDEIEALTLLEEQPQYDLVLDREWFSMVGAPLLRVRDLSSLITALLTGAILLVLGLVTALLLLGRRREAGILLSLGESRGKTAAQLAVEVFLPLALALALGLGLGVTAGGNLVEQLCSGVYQQSAAISQGENDLVTHAHTAQNKMSRDIYTGTYADDLLERVGERILVVPPAQVQLDRQALGIYLGLALLVCLVGAGAQIVSVLRLQPARVLTGKE